MQNGCESFVLYPAHYASDSDCSELNLSSGRRQWFTSHHLRVVALCFPSRFQDGNSVNLCLTVHEFQELTSDSYTAIALQMPRGLEMLVPGKLLFLDASYLVDSRSNVPDLPQYSNTNWGLTERWCT